nr:MAG TPA: hypothetical protein [Caudoviricetes sp.]
MLDFYRRCHLRTTQSVDRLRVPVKSLNLLIMTG